jgi:hypothetical protein
MMTEKKLTNFVFLFDGRLYDLAINNAVTPSRAST